MYYICIYLLFNFDLKGMIYMKKNQSFLLVIGSIILGIIGFLPSLLTVVGIDSKTKLNPRYYNSKDEPLFVEDKKSIE